MPPSLAFLSPGLGACGGDQVTAFRTPAERITMGASPSFKEMHVVNACIITAQVTQDGRPLSLAVGGSANIFVPKKSRKDGSKSRSR